MAGYKEQEQNPARLKEKGKLQRTRIKAFLRMKKGFDKCYQFQSYEMINAIILLKLIPAISVMK